MTHRMTPLALATSLALASLFATTAVQAQGLAAASIVRLDIDAGPLDQVLGQFGRQAGIPLSIDASLTAGKSSPGVKGELSVAQAFAQLLNGTGLSPLRTENGNYLVVPATQQNGALELDATSINSRLDGGATEDSGSYTTGSMNTATRMNLSIKDTPQSISVVTRQQMDDQNMQSLDDVARAATGISAVKGFGTERSQYYSRGFLVSDLQYDGIPTSVAENFSMDVTSVNNMAIYDHVEFVRGANGLLQGAGNPSAAINLVRKRPTDSYQLKAEIGAGSWDDYRAQIDVSGPLNEQGTLRGRTVLMYNTSDSHVDRAGKDNQLFYAIGEADVSDATTVSLGTILQRDYHRSYDWGGLPTRLDGSFYPFSRSASFAPDWTHLNKLNRTVFGDIKHRFNDDWKLTVNANANWSNADFLGLYGYNNGGDELELDTNDTHYDDEQLILDAAIDGAFEAFGRKHEVVFGGSARRDRFINDSRYNNNFSVIDINTFHPSQVERPTYGYERVRYRTLRKDKGVYAATRLNASDDLHLILGSRLSWVDYDSGTDYFKENRKVIPYGGVVYDLTTNTSLYASYTEIYKLQSNYDVDNKLLSPITGANYEIGLKNELYGGRLNSSLALFQVDQSHMPEALNNVARTCSPTRAATCYEEGGKVRSRGFDIEVSGELLSGWNAMLGYTYAHPEYVGGKNKGSDYATNTSPQRLLKLATSYRLPGALQDVSVGGSFRHQSKVYQDSIQQSAYNLVDLNTQYRINRNFDVQLNLNNVFDKKYYASIFSTDGGNYYGEPRNFALTLRYQN